MNYFLLPVPKYHSSVENAYHGHVARVQEWLVLVDVVDDPPVVWYGWQDQGDKDLVAVPRVLVQLEQGVQLGEVSEPHPGVVFVVHRPVLTDLSFHGLWGRLKRPSRVAGHPDRAASVNDQDLLWNNRICWVLYG